VSPQITVHGLFLLRPDRGAEYCDDCVCLSVCSRVCLSTSISVELRVRFSPIFEHGICGRGSVLLWLNSDFFAICYVLSVLRTTS